MRLPLSLSLVLAAAAPAPAAQEPLQVAIVWHQHQPRYPIRPGSRVYEQPWVRLHAAKDYYDMAAIAAGYPGLELTINLTPVLLQQLDDYNAGATDRHAELAMKPAASLTAAEQAEARQRFFQVSGPMLARWPRLQALKALPAAKWDAQAYRDAATLFHLAWTDPDFLAERPLRALAAQKAGFTEADKRIVLAAHREIMKKIVPLHRQLQDEGKIEVTTTPYFHPILPLIHDSALAREALPQAPMPQGRFRWPEDARFHVEAGAADYERRFGRAPRGMWPGEGSVAQAVAPLFKQAGIRWIATDEDVLARSLGVKLREGEELTPAGADALYRPYQVKDGPAIVFRDRKLSDDIGFRYGKMPGAAAAADLLGQLGAIAARPRKGPRLVTLILDGENAWENYPDDGKAFLRSLYHGLTTDPRFRTTTPAAYLKTHAPTPLKRLWSGSWIGASYATWIGEDEENRAWDLLAAARQAVADHARRKGARSPANRRAMDKIHAAEGSDWFWWYGQDQDSGRDHEFDEAYRRLLAGVYADIGAKPPAALALPIIEVGAKPTREPAAYLAPRIDGPMDRTEWARAGSVFAEGGAMATGGRPFDALFYGWDKTSLYLAVQHGKDAQPFAVLFGKPGKGGGTAVPGAPFGVHARADVDARGHATLGFPGKPGPAVALAGGHGRGTSELAIPWKALGVRSGDPLTLVLQAKGGAFPAQPLRVKAPVLAATPLVTLTDAPETGIGPGFYALPTGGAYTREAVDLRGLTVAEEDGQWAFTWKLGAVRDPWGSPVGLSLVALDCYVAPGVFTEGRTPPKTPLLDARDAQADRPWTAALAVEGWQQGLYAPNGDRLAELPVAVDPLAAEVRAFVPKAQLAGDPRNWAFLATLAGQDGFAPGRIRKVMPATEADRFGGRRLGRGSNLLDVLLPEGANQALLLDPASGPVVLPFVRPTE
jgi:alpha-amylase/alpha-mannosidase (GH57 family)